MASKIKIEKMIEPETGVVHLMDPSGCGEYTMCGIAFDEPSSERNQQVMAYTKEKINCPDCIETARQLHNYLTGALKEIK